VTLEKTLWIDAAPEIVRSYFLDAAKVMAWTGQAAEVDPRPGGAYRIDMGAAGWLDGCFTLIAEDRIEHAFDLPGVTGRSTVAISLTAEAGGTRLTIRHAGLPLPLATIAVRGWDHHLARLSVAATGGTPAADTLCARPMDTLA